MFDSTNAKCNYLFISSIFVLLSITYNLFPFVQDDLDEHVDVTDSRLRVMFSFMHILKSACLVVKLSNIEHLVVVNASWS